MQVLGEVAGVVAVVPTVAGPWVVALMYVLRGRWLTSVESQVCELSCEVSCWQNHPM